MMYEPIDRTKALKALWELHEVAFGHDKGSGEAYQEFCETLDLCEPWDGESDVEEENLPPGFLELLIAAGVHPQELYDAIQINPDCFPADQLARYGYPPLEIGEEE